MLFFITDIGILSYMEGMNTIMTALIATAVVDAAACHDGHIRTIRDIEIIINQIRHAGNTDYNRDEHFFTLCITVNQDIDPRLIFFLTDLDVLAVSMTDRYAILAKIISTFLRKSFADLIQNPLGGLIDLCHQQTPPSSPFAHLPQPSCVNRVGRTSSRLPYCFTSPSSITMILSAIRMIRS